MSQEKNALMFRLQLRLKSSTPDSVIQTVRAIAGLRTSHMPKHPLTHAFWYVPRWIDLLRNTTELQQRFATHEVSGDGKFGMIKYTMGRITFREYPEYFELKGIGISGAEEQDFALFLSWLSPYLVRAPGDQWLALLQSYVFYSPLAGRRKTKAGLIKLYSHPAAGSQYPTLHYRGGRLPELVKHIL